MPTTLAKSTSGSRAAESPRSVTLEAEVSFAMGTDAGTPFTQGDNSTKELEFMVDYGVTPEAAPWLPP